MLPVGSRPVTVGQFLGVAVRIRRVVTLLVIVGLTGLFSGAAGGAAPTAEAAVTAAIGFLPAHFQPAPAPEAAAPDVIAPMVAAPEVVPSPAAAPVLPVAEAPAAAASVQAAVQPQAAAPRPRLAAGTPCRSTARACIELSSNRAWLIRNGEVSYGPVPITSGRTGYRTPTGTFHVTFRNRDHVSSIYDVPMPYSVFFNGGIAFHQGSLREKSHGCIHLSRSAAREFFDSLRRGDVVQVVR